MLLLPIGNDGSSIVFGSNEWQEWEVMMVMRTEMELSCCCDSLSTVSDAEGWVMVARVFSMGNDCGGGCI